MNVTSQYLHAFCNFLAGTVAVFQDRLRQGRGSRAYREVFTACPGRRQPCQPLHWDIEKLLMNETLALPRPQRLQFLE